MSRNLPKFVPGDMVRIATKLEPCMADLMPHGVDAIVAEITSPKRCVFEYVVVPVGAPGEAHAWYPEALLKFMRRATRQECREFLVLQ